MSTPKGQGGGPDLFDVGSSLDLIASSPAEIAQARAAVARLAPPADLRLVLAQIFDDPYPTGAVA